MAEPYLVTVIRQIADIEAADTHTPDDTARLNMCRRWLDAHYPEVGAALAAEYLSMRSELIGDITGWHPIGWQGPAQHTYTRGCDGFHEPGQCPRTEHPQSALDAYQEASNELHDLTGD